MMCLHMPEKKFSIQICTQMQQVRLKVDRWKFKHTTNQK